MELLGDINKYLPLILTVVSVLFWFIRLELMTKENHRRVKDLERCRNESDAKTEGMKESIVRLETMMNEMIKSIAEIKASIQQINEKLYDRKSK